MSEGVKYRLPLPANINRQICQWRKLYKNIFGVELNFSRALIPQRKAGFTRLLIVAKGMKLMRILRVLSKIMNVESFRGVKEVTSRRSAKKTYAVWVKNCREADKNLGGLTATWLSRYQINGITLEERLLFEIKYFLETGRHLDIGSTTICYGSRCADGTEPTVSYDTWGGRQKMIAIRNSLAYGPYLNKLRVREVVC